MFKKKGTTGFKKKTQPPQKEMTHLTYLCDKYKSLVEKYKLQMTESGETFTAANLLRLDTIPDFASQIGDNGLPFWGFTDNDGNTVKVEIKEDIKVNISQDNYPKAISFIKDQGSESIIKTEIVIKFDGEDKEEIERLKMLLNENKFFFEAKPTINTATLKSWVKGLRESGVEFDEKVFGVFDFKECKIPGVKLTGK